MRALLCAESTLMPSAPASGPWLVSPVSTDSIPSASRASAGPLPSGSPSPVAAACSTTSTIWSPAPEVLATNGPRQGSSKDGLVLSPVSAAAWLTSIASGFPGSGPTRYVPVALSWPSEIEPSHWLMLPPSFTVRWTGICTSATPTSPASRKVWPFAFTVRAPSVGGPETWAWMKVDGHGSDGQPTW